MNIIVGILTLNNEDVIKNALDSVKKFNEIIICDGGSSDRTLEIARKYNCKILYQKKNFKFSSNKIKNFSGVRNQILEESKNKFVFFLDSDEYINKNLSNYLLTLKAKKIANLGIGLINRKYIIKKNLIHYSSTYPNFHARLINKYAVKGFIKLVHEKPILKDNTFKKFHLPKKFFISVPINEDPRYLIKKFNYYTSIEVLMLANSTFINFLKFLNFRILVLFLLIAKIVRNFFIFKKNKMPIKHELILIFVYFKNVFSLFLNYVIKIK